MRRKNLNDATLKSNAGASATESLGIKDSNKQISPEHQAILSKRLESVESDIRLEQNTMDMTRIDARKMQMTGDLIMKKLGHGRRDGGIGRAVRRHPGNVPNSKLAR